MSIVRPLSFPEVRVVEASAGSGKTYTLAKRYIQLLMTMLAEGERSPVRSVLAITFTNKATHEMRERILLFLKYIALDAFPDDGIRADILGSLDCKPEVAKARAEALIAMILSDFDRFNIQTIDSFVKILLSNSTYDLGFSSRLAVKTDQSRLVRYCLDRMLEDAESEPRTKELFERFLTRFMTVDDKAAWNPADDIENVISGMLSQDRKYPGTFVKSARSSVDIPALRATILAAAKALQEDIVRSDVAMKPSANLKKALAKLADAKTGFDLDLLSSKKWLEESPEVNKGGAVPDEITRQWTSLRTMLRELAEAEAFTAYDVYLDLYAALSRHIAEHSAKEGAVYISEINKKARGIYESTDTVDELYCRLSARFLHFMIDEFQDTSLLRWLNIARLAEEAVAGKGTLFYVGDRKQAIYGFSGGDPRLFSQVAEELTGLPGRTSMLVKESLDTNFRSRAEIVGFNNRVFDRGNLIAAMEDPAYFDDDAREELLAVYANAEQKSRPSNSGGFVRVDTLESEKKDERIDEAVSYVLRVIGETRARFAFGETAILVRKTEEVAVFSRALFDAKIPVASKATMDVREHPLIGEIMACLRFLLSPIDDASFAAFAGGELLTSAAGIEQSAMHEFFFARRPKKGEAHLPLYRRFRETFPKAWAGIVEPLYRAVGVQPLYELIVLIYETLGAMRLRPDAQGFFMHLLTLIKASEADCRDIAQFIAYFDGLEDATRFVPGASADAVTVITEHAAKGLEYPLVIIPHLGMDVKTSSQSPSRIAHEIADEAITVYRNGEKFARHSPLLEGKLADESRKSYREELNLVYVALTRAKEELYIAVPGKYGRGSNATVALMAAVAGKSFGQCDETRCPKRHAATAGYADVSSYAAWVERVREEFVGLGPFTDDAARRAGVLVHRVLAGEMVDDAAANDSAQRVKTVPACARFFAPGLDVRDEYELCDANGDLLRPDRVIVGKDTVTVVDYKSHRPKDDSGYRAQVTRYCEVLRSLYAGKKIEGYLLYIDTCEVVAV